MPLTGGMGRDGKREMALKGMATSPGARCLWSGFFYELLSLNYDVLKVPRPNVSRTPLFRLDSTTPCSVY